MLRILPHCYISPSSKLSQLLHLHKNSRDLRPTFAKKSNVGENSQIKGPSFFNLRVTRSLVAKTAIVIFGLGFLDAGYSRDWSRIGVISEETEEVLKSSAFVVVPVCLLVAYFISDEEKTV